MYTIYISFQLFHFCSSNYYRGYKWLNFTEFNLNLSQMAIKFCEIQPFVTSVIIGATKMEQLKTNIDSVNINLDKELIKKIGQIHKKYPNPCP